MCSQVTLRGEALRENMSPLSLVELYLKPVVPSAPSLKYVLLSLTWVNVGGEESHSG